ncbi:MAG TPA: carbohydrate ABC transporter permease, partial [Clostridia bacterium]|nr:carbohydrate ABC transporter permease [Clostridia bacterium]
MSFVSSKRLTAFDYVNGVLITLVSLACLLPFLYLVSVSLTDVDVYVPFTFQLFPKKFSLDAYRYILGTSTFTNALQSTTLVTVVGTAIALMVTYPAAYALSKRGMPLYGLISGLVIFTLVFSAGIIPTFTVVRNLGLMNTYWALMLPIATDSWSLIVVKSFMDSLPCELEDSAKIDGCTDLGVFFRIILPLSMASIAAFTLFFAVARWNIYFDALLYINDNAKRTLQVLVKSMVIDNNTQSAGSATGWGDAQMPSEVVRSATVMV